ncbi:hypothetical protein NQ318_020855 [Aromia moschata]|uniref:Uncharacterized protein n=1 Tax=Aromia moschata TaxID=1265417 RepID=A0AAV8XKQ8_9CUCU|nr:hypothetical protein NQ318_020855 [Aromia moschata]
MHADHFYQKLVFAEEANVVIRIAQTEWRNVQSIILCSNTLCTDVMSSRELINRTLATLIDSLRMCDCPAQKERYVGNVVKATYAITYSY